MDINQVKQWSILIDGPFKHWWSIFLNNWLENEWFMLYYMHPLWKKMSNYCLTLLLVIKMTKYLLFNQTWKLNWPPGRFTVKWTSHVISKVQLKVFILLTDRVAYNIPSNFYAQLSMYWHFLKCRHSGWGQLPKETFTCKIQMSIFKFFSVTDLLVVKDQIQKIKHWQCI